MSNKNVLPTQVDRLLMFMRAQELDIDVYIKDMYEAATGRDYSPERHRYAQQRVGAMLTRINRQIYSEGKIITTGHGRGTYRVTTIAE